MDEEFLEDQIENNEKEAASVNISFSPSNDNLNNTLKSLPKENNQQKKRKLTSKVASSNDIDKQKLFLMRTIRGNMEKRRQE